MKTLLSFLFFAALSLPTLAQFRYAPDKPQVGQTVSFTYTPQGPLATDSTIEGRFVRYGAPTMMHLSRTATVSLTRQGTDFVGQLYIPQKDVSGAMLLFRNSRQPKRTDLNKNLLYVIPIYDATGRLVPHATGGQASVFTRANFLYEAGGRPDPNRVVALYEQELKEYPDAQPLYWSDYLAALIRQKKPGYGPKVKTGIESYIASRPAPTAAELTAAAQLYESMGDFASRTDEKTGPGWFISAERPRDGHSQPTRLDPPESDVSGIRHRVSQLVASTPAGGWYDRWLFQK